MLGSHHKIIRLILWSPFLPFRQSQVISWLSFWQHVEYLCSKMRICGRNPEDKRDYEPEIIMWNENNIQSDGKLTQDGNGAAQSEVGLDSRDGGSACRFVYSFICQPCLFSSLERFCKISCVHIWESGWKSVGLCGVLSLSHDKTSHTQRAKWWNLGMFGLMLVVSIILKILWDVKNSFGVPA